MLQLITKAVTDRGAQGIAAAVSRLVHSGELPAGARLPTVRSIARELGVSPTTVSEAWSWLTRAGLIATRGRSGTIVLGGDRLRSRMRYARLAPGVAAATDLSTGVPDHELLPDLTESLRRLGAEPLTTSYLDDPVLPALEAHLFDHWPYAAQQLTVVDGALDALDRVVRAHVRFGDRVLVENPTFPPILDLIDAAGATAVPVALDRQGITPDSLAQGLEAGALMLILQPRAHNPTGVSMTGRRASDLAALLTSHPSVIVVEDDHAADITSAPPVSLGCFLPGRTVHIRSYAKSLGPDLRLAAVGGPASVLAPVVDRRMLGPGWSSRLLQHILLDLLTSPSTAILLETARSEYARRRLALLAALAQEGAVATADDGINLWLEVADERAALVALAAHGVAVAPGAPFEAAPLGQDHVRVTVGLVRDGFPELASVLAAAARAVPRGGARSRSFPRGTR
ncbi:aminotransferase class I/II-fold pyridoxal phosphate-dependent enzyme [Hamadaea sp. NPDC051192]|uniref:aminotransferase class I/II-fold pyridoxal phosphate-dependent enzyme n=1 Tax=Hamadaea sp. NPDC051192 TaxID=3154940 RepID=UPI003427D22B